MRMPHRARFPMFGLGLVLGLSVLAGTARAQFPVFNGGTALTPAGTPLGASVNRYPRSMVTRPYVAAPLVRRETVVRRPAYYGGRRWFGWRGRRYGRRW